ncbi:MAG: hypothetical protein ACTSVY_07175 [Candidatus Helarchaeota archaeon]
MLEAVNDPESWKVGIEVVIFAYIDSENKLKDNSESKSLIQEIEQKATYLELRGGYSGNIDK